MRNMLHHWNTDLRGIMAVFACLSLGQCAFMAEFRTPQSGLLPNDTDSLLVGPLGPAVEPDMSYCQMILEAPVPPTADQVPWYCICSACSAQKSQKGEKGGRGLPGSPGSSGPRGLTGFPGRPGPTGRPGIKGEKGEIGDKGEMGPIGRFGLKGDRGFKGDKGESGLDGPEGQQGPKGEDGQCPEICEPVSGAPGEAGLPGPAGPRGIPGLNGASGSKGQKGDPGVIGTPGDDGVPGQKGDQGPEGMCNCTDGTPGTQGPKGEFGEKGDTGAPGPQGLSGATGPKGYQGEMGIEGMPGPCSPAVQSAFSAALATSFPAPNRPVVFRRIIYNHNQNYNPENGLYIAPVNGTYVFSYHLQVSTRTLKVGLFHNFEPVIKTTTLIEMNTASQQVVMGLLQGDWVWLQVRDSSTNGMFAGTESSSTFSGFLLHPDRCDDMALRDFHVNQEITGDFSWGKIDEPNP